MSTFNAESTTDDVVEGISLAGKLAVVTGASTGLGLETSRILAQQGATVLMVARNAQKLEAALATIRQAIPTARLEAVLMDLADLESVRAAAATIVQDHPGIDLLVNNAGVMFCPLGHTEQGFEMQFGTNHMGHFLFTCLLVPALLEQAPGRVVVLSSGAHKMAPVNLEDPNYTQREYNKWLAYGESKTANVLFAVALDARLKGRGVRTFAVHPGIIITELGRHMSPEDMEQMMAMAPKGEEIKFKSIPQGAATSVWAATSEDLSGRGGIYLENCQIADPAVAGVDGGVESYALDADTAERLWASSEEMVGQSFSF
jgi:NAD(P)-dependent dehydrogenase (short-subunit alcohol dehydrogenase family)